MKEIEIEHVPNSPSATLCWALSLALLSSAILRYRLREYQAASKIKRSRSTPPIAPPMIFAFRFGSLGVDERALVRPDAVGVAS
jgi:hypothetical protein